MEQAEADEEVIQAQQEPGVEELVPAVEVEDSALVEEPEEEYQTLEDRLLRPIRGVLNPVSTPVNTSTLTPVGKTLVPAKKRGPPPSTSAGRPTASLRPVKGTLTPVTKAPVKTMVPESLDEEDED
jgi:hypothetical protein